MRTLLLLLLSALTLAAQPGALAPGTVRSIEAAVNHAMAEGKIPGLTVAVATAGELRWSKGFGKADVENNVPATPETVYRLGSISKPITAVAVMQLAERGRLDLDATVQKYVPTFPEKPWPITVRQLLGHLGGIRHYRSQAEVDSTRHYTNLLDPLAIFQDDPLVAEPGTRYSYTTYGYVLLGAILESASGSPYMGYVSRSIFAPAGMDHTQADDVYAIIPHRARGYRLRPDGTVENCSLADTSNKIPGGGMSAPASDLVRFALAVLGGKLVQSETRTVMFTPQKLRNGEPTGYGLGWAIGDAGGMHWVGHSGGQQGVATMLVMAPGRGDVVVVMSNLEAAGVGQLALSILRLIGE